MENLQESPITIRLNSLLEGRRKKANPTSQKALAQAVGVKEGTLSVWLKDNKPFPSDYIVPICSYLKVSPTWLLTGVEQEEEEINLPLTADAIQVATDYDLLDAYGKAEVAIAVKKAMTKTPDKSAESA